MFDLSYFFSKYRNHLLSLIVLCLVAICIIAWNGWRYLNIPVDSRARVINFVVSPGASFGQVLSQMNRDGIAEWPEAIKFYAVLTGQASQIKAGEYQISSELTPLAMLEMLVQGEVRQYKFIIIEGWSFKQLRDELSKTGEVLALELPGKTGTEIMSSIGSPNVHPEGQFMPDTYQFSRDSTDTELLRRAHHAMREYLDGAWPKRDENLAIDTPYEALILASIVEKETGSAEERPQIAGVFMSRLRLNMRLQTDPTIIYGLGDDFDGDIRRKHLKQDTPYNTYTRQGLTPTPIAMPGRASIDAVLHPASTDALYFVSRGDGTHKFSRTLEEHEAAVDKYQRGQ